jgi:hypothetical protein
MIAARNNVEMVQQLKRLGAVACVGAALMAASLAAGREGHAANDAERVASYQTLPGERSDVVRMNRIEVTWDADAASSRSSHLRADMAANTVSAASPWLIASR